MRKVRLFVIITLIVVMIIISGCNNLTFDKGKGEETEAGGNLEPKTEISIALWELAQISPVNDPLSKRLEKQLNIKIKPVSIPATEYTQTYQIWAASGQLPDVFAVDAVNSQYYRNWVNKGIIRALPDNLSKYPNLTTYLNSSDFQYLKDNGKMYCIPRKTYDSTDYNFLDRVVAYRWDLAKEAGITKEPETFEEFADLLDAIIKKDPEKKDIQGFTCVNNILIGGFFWLYSSPSATSDGSGSDFKWIKEDGRYIPAVFSKSSVESLKMIRSYYNRGIIDKDILATRGEMAFDKFAQGKVAAVLSSSSVNSVDNSIFKQRWLKLHPNDKDFYDRVKFLKPLKSIDGKRYHAVFKSYWSESYIPATVSDQKMDKILKLFDYLATDEHLVMRRYGIESVDYSKVGEKYVKTSPKQDIELKYKYMSVLSTLLSWDGMFKIGPDYTSISEECQKAQTEFIEYVLKETIKQEYNIRLTYFSTPTKDGFTIFDSDDMFRVMISNKPVEKEWQDIIDEYKQKGLDKMIEEVNLKAKEMGIN